MLVTETIYKFGGKAYSSNCYVFQAEEELILIDTGAPSYIEPMLWEMKNAKLDPNKITHVINTHCHVDHIGGNHKLKEKFNPEFFAHRLDAEHIKTPDRFTADSLLDEELMGIDVTMIDDGFKIDGTPLEVIHTPGHPLGSICLYDHDAEILISGDTIFAQGVGRTDLPGGNTSNLQASLKKLSELGVRLLLPGHGPHLERGGDKAIAQACQLVQGFGDMI